MIPIIGKCTSLVGSLDKTLLPSICIVSTRSFHPKSYPQFEGKYRGEIPRRMGYEAHHHTEGLLPRLKIKEPILKTLPMTAKEDEWSRRLATMGKNDFYRILGDDEDFKQYDLLDHIPDWLRGYRAQREYSVLMLRRKEFDYWKNTKPTKWHHIESRIKYLYRRINNKYMPPDIEKLGRPRYSV